MKRQRKNPAKKTVPAKKAAKPTRRGKISVETIVRRRVQAKMVEVARMAAKATAIRVEAAEQKAARLEEENVKFAKELFRWQDTVKLRDQAIERKEQRIKELMEKCQQLTSQVTELTGMQEGLAPSGLQYGKVLEAEVEARKQAQEERDLANKRAIEHESTIAELANEVARLRGDLARYNTPAQPVPEPHHQVTEWTLTFADLVEFSRLFKPREGG